MNQIVGLPDEQSGVVNDRLAKDREMVAFACRWWPDRYGRERAIRRRFGISGPQFFQRLNRVLDSPQALKADPAAVRRLRRLRARGRD
jgi:hypothetical protein